MAHTSVNRAPRNGAILFTLNFEGPPFLGLALCSLLIAALTLCACSRPAQTAAAPAPPPPFEYVDAWGVHGDGPGQFAKPVAITSDDESIIYIADAATGFINKFSPGGEPRLSFQDDRSNLHPADIAVDAGSAIYVADGRRGTVAIFFSDGMRHRELRTNALSAERESLHIAVDAYGTIYVTAKHPYGIHKFSPGLRPAGSWGGASTKGAAVNAQIDNPTALAVGPDGLVYVSERANPEVKVYDTTGTLLHSAVVATDTDPYLTGIAVNRKFIFAVAASHPSVYVWSLDGSFQFTQDLSTWVAGVGSSIVRKIVVTPAGDLLLLDTAAARVFRFRLHL
ncbi:MAG TPA: NHL repeat-containing protein [Candidatus Acidoferrum sp.]|nr:NHL repeat-containing protein [Candidatus Acidoferrum sp.]